jgi:hypothetical protein
MDELVSDNISVNVDFNIDDYIRKLVACSVEIRRNRRFTFRAFQGFFFKRMAASAHCVTATAAVLWFMRSLRGARRRQEMTV